jgi:hypothetical protein
MKILWDKQEDIRIYMYRPSGACDYCEKPNVGEPHSFVTLNGGGLLKKWRLIGRKSDYSTSEKVEGFLSLGWHGADSEAGGLGDYPDTSAQHEIATNDFEGQFEFYFCSTDCLRRFLNRCVDDLEQKIQEAVAKQQAGGE